jgi:hypothetical protein
VRDRRSKRLAEAIADTVRGVVDVHNRLTLAEERRGGRGPGQDTAAGRQGGGERNAAERQIGDREPGGRPVAEGRDPDTGRLLEAGELVGARQEERRS